jgi:hypothetical protein
MNLTTQQKLDQLKTIYTNSSQQAKEQIYQWEDEFVALKVKQDWLNHPNTKEIRDRLEAHINNINNVLMNEYNLPDDERKNFIKVKLLAQSILTVIGGDVEQQIINLDNKLNNEI